MRRKITEALEEWLESRRRTCPLIRGARQVGKTYVVDEFAKTHFKYYLKLDFAKDPVASTAFNESLDVDEIILSLTSKYPRQKFVPGKTLLFFDEIQECPRARTALKFFAMDQRYRVIASGSLLGLRLKEIPQIPVGYEEPIYLGPMDFEEFLWAMGTDEKAIGYIRDRIRKTEPFADEFLKGMMKVFRRYLVVGGMPEAVLAFSTDSKLDVVRAAQRKIVSGYIADIEKYSDERQKARVLSCFNGIAPLLAKQNKKFMFSEIETEVDYRVGMKYYSYSLDWLNMASIVLFCNNLTEIAEPLEERVVPSEFKVYMRDTGLLISMYSDNVADKILSGDLNVNRGAIAENFVAGALDLQGRGLMFYGNRSKRVETDYVTEMNGHIAAIEVKSGRNTRSASLNKVIGDDVEGIMFETRNIFVDDKGVKHYPLFAAAFLDCIDLHRLPELNNRDLVDDINRMAEKYSEKR